MPVQFVPEYYTNNSLDKSIDNMGKVMAQQANQRHQQNMLMDSYFLEASLHQKAADLQRGNLELAYKLESDRQKLEIELQEKKQLESQLKINQLKLKKIIHEQHVYQYKIEKLSYAIVGLSVLVILYI